MRRKGRQGQAGGGGSLLAVGTMGCSRCMPGGRMTLTGGKVVVIVVVGGRGNRGGCRCRNLLPFERQDPRSFLTC